MLVPVRYNTVVVRLFVMEILSFALIQLQESLAPHTADPHGLWHDCTLNNERCSPSQIQFLQGMPYSFC